MGLFGSMPARIAAIVVAALGGAAGFFKARRLASSALLRAKFWRRLTPAPSAASPVVIAVLMSLKGNSATTFFSRSSLFSSLATAVGLNF
jgi:hypothetical protein